MDIVKMILNILLPAPQRAESKKNPNPYKVYLILLGLLLSCTGKRAQSLPDVSALACGFISPSNQFEKLLGSIKVSSREWDSCVQLAIQINARPAGVFSELLKDSSGVEFALGWKTPGSFRRDTLYPLIIYLHGGTGTTLNSKGEKAYDMLTPLSDTFSLFLASPSANRFTPWWSPQGMGRILQTLRFMTLHYPINPNKVFLAGVSDGATGCYGAANTISAPFAGFIAISGFGGMVTQVAMPLIPSNLMQRPIYNVNAGKDRIYPLSQIMEFLGWLANNGVRVDHKEYPDEEHGFDYRPKEFSTLAGYVRLWSKPSNAPSFNWTFTPGFPMCADNIIEYLGDNSAQTIRLTGAWDHDTLKISSNGIKEAIISFPFPVARDIFISRNSAPPHKMHAMAQSPLLSYKVMIHAGFPFTKNCPCYRIVF